MEKFRISQNFTISDIDNDNEEQEENEHNNDELDDGEQDEDAEDEDDIRIDDLQGHYVLYDEAHDREYLINETIKYFIDKFFLPKTKAEVLQEIEAEVKSNDITIEETCSHFFAFLCKIKVLVPENHEEPVIAETSLYKEGDCLHDLIIEKVISGRHRVEIYAATDEINNCKYVIKLLNRNKIADIKTFDDEQKLLEREYLFLKTVCHISSICKAYSFVKDRISHPYIILEYINGKTLHYYLRETKSLNKKLCLKTIENILAAFSSLHQSKLVHGDIHSSNIIVTEDNNVKIIDLGLTVNVVEIEKNEMVKFGGVIFYMPPERINNTTINKYTKHADLYSDVYQIGLLIYLILYNKMPFKGFIWEDLANNIKASNPPFPDTSFLNYKISKGVINIVKKCLAKNPFERFQNATEVLESFERYSLKEKSTLVN